MHLPPSAASGETLLNEYGLYHLTRLKAAKNLQDMAGSWEKCQNRLKGRVDSHQAAQAGTMTAMAVRDGEDTALDDAVRAFALAVLQKANNNRKAPFYLNYFPQGWSAVVSAPLENEIQKVGVILSKLAEESDESLSAYAGPIRAAMDSLTAAMDAHRAALESELQAYGLVQTEKINWFDTYKLNHRTLAQMFYQDPKKADTYFKPAPKGKKPAAPAPEAPVKA